MNGYNSVDVATFTGNELEILDAELADLGVTSWLASLITRDLKEMADVISRLDAVKVQGMKGIHAEGPFLGSIPGAHPIEHVIPINIEWIS
jgi:N-acetylglucosamine-6-phosphate deacetylase